MTDLELTHPELSFPDMMSLQTLTRTADLIYDWFAIAWAFLSRILQNFCNWYLQVQKIDLQLYLHHNRHCYQC